MNHFFDVGANNGSTFGRYIVPNVGEGTRVWCFEPSPQCWPQLISQISQCSNQFKIALCPFALSNKWGVHRLYQRVVSEGDSIFAEAVGFDGTPAIAVQSDYQISVAAVPVVDFILGHTEAGDTITLKLDCEGSEYAILNSLLENKEALERCGEIMVEWHVGHEVEIIRLLRDFAIAGHPLGQWNY